MDRIGLKIACAAAALVIWIQVASTTLVEADLSLPVAVAHLPEGLTLAGSDVPATAAVRIRAPKLRVIAHKYLHRPIGRVQLDLARQEAGASFLYEITAADVLTEQQVVAVLPPARLPLRLDREESRSLPVKVATAGQLPSGLVLVAPLAARPPTVQVTGPRRQVREATTIAAGPVDLSQLTTSQSLAVALQLPGDGLRAEPPEVQVEARVAPLTRRVVPDVPVTAHGAAGRRIAVSPSRCDVTVEGPAAAVAALRAADLRVIVDAGEAPDGGRLRARVEGPDWATSLTAEPETFTVVTDESPAERRR